MPAAIRIPSATYRLQFNRDFTLSQAIEVLPYLHRLGISDSYASPLFQASPGSTHGYDVCGFDVISPALGGGKEFESFCAALRALGMGLMLDMVPNHMGNDLSNRWWLDVLANGKQSVYASWFDIDWKPVVPGCAEQVLLPILEDRYGKVLEAGKLRIVPEKDRFALAYYERRFPLNTRGLQVIQGIVGPERDAERIRQLNGTPGSPDSFRQLDQIIQMQHYRLAYWRLGPQEINYRRFFDITELVSLRMEDPAVFHSTHKMLIEIARQEAITGLRIDHPDGLWNPRQYFERLRPIAPLYVVAEKILSGDEPLPPDWPVAGTTGYDFLNKLNGLFVAAEMATRFSAVYERFTGCSPSSFRSLVQECKRLVLERSFPREINALTQQLKEIFSRTRSGRDFTLSELRGAISGLAVAFPIYRTYITETSASVSPVEKQAILSARKNATLEQTSADRAALDLITSVLLLEMPADFDETARRDCRKWMMRFQQLTGPLMAKGVEDTVFYRFNRLLSLNEVGSEPERFGLSLRDFHEQNAKRHEDWPHALLATATHDTKRGEDLRARLNVLSEIPQQWARALARWHKLNGPARSRVAGVVAPDPNDEYFIYQTILGAWHPAQTGVSEEFFSRIANCVKKSLKEAKRHTSWTDPNEDYERATLRFLETILKTGSPNQFLTDMKRFLEPIAFHGFINSISQTLLKMASPGVPDFYQGAELWDFNLVDPDNRRPVDYKIRESLLLELEHGLNSPGFLKRLMTEWRAGDIKLFTIWRFLNYRRKHRHLFQDGGYIPVEATGKHSAHICSFARLSDGDAILIAAPRLSFTLMEGGKKLPLGRNVWEDTSIRIPQEIQGEFTCLFSGRKIRLGASVAVGDLLSDYLLAAATNR